MVRPTAYTQVRTPTTAGGCALLRYDIRFLWTQFEMRTLRETIDALWNRSQHIDLERRFEELGITGNKLTLEPQFALESRGPQIRFKNTAKDLKRLADDADDLREEDGHWQDWREQLNDLAKRTTEELQQLLKQGVMSLAKQYGPKLAHQAIAQIRQQLQIHYEQIIQQAQPWALERTTLLEEKSQLLQSFSRPSDWRWKLANCLLTNLSPTMWLTQRQRGQINDAIKAIQAASDFRYEQDLLRAKRRVFETLLGREGKSGFLDTLTQEVEKLEQFFRNLAESFEEPTLTSKDSAVELSVVKHIDEWLDRRQYRRLVDLFREKLQAAGCSPEAFAEELWLTGIEIDHRLLKPGEWMEADLNTVRQKLLEQGRLYLGSSNPNKPLNINEPTTALEWVASVTLVHPEIRPLVRGMISEWGRRSRPYAIHARMKQANPSIQRYLFCYPPDRPKWEQWLINEGRPVSTRLAETGMDEYTVGHPYLLVLAQFGFGYPGHAQPSYLRGLFLAKRSGATENTEPLHDFDRNVELRLIAQREDSYQDACEVFNALQLAGEIRAIEGAHSGYVLANPDMTLQSHFRVRSVEPEWKTSQQFHRLLRYTKFRNFVDLSFPELPQWNDLAARLAHHHDSDYVAARLADQGILTMGEMGQYRMAGSLPKALTQVPRGLYTVKYGAPRGLSRDHFLSQLQRSDWFYTVMFWRVIDAFAEQRLSFKDLPTFAQAYVKAQLL